MVSAILAFIMAGFRIAVRGTRPKVSDERSRSDEDEAWTWAWYFGVLFVAPVILDLLYLLEQGVPKVACWLGLSVVFPILLGIWEGVGILAQVAGMREGPYSLRGQTPKLGRTVAWVLWIAAWLLLAAFAVLEWATDPIRFVHSLFGG